MPTALIADDEEAPRAQLARALRGVWPELEAVHEAINGVEAWDAFLEHEPDVCFLDVRMPGLTGIEVAQRIGTRAQIVFVTAYGDHALAAFDAGAVDYVLKPVDAGRLAQAVDRVKARLAAPGATPGGVDLQAVLARLAGQLRKPAPLDVLQAAIGKEVRLVPVASVVYFESDARYTRVVYEEPGPGGARSDPTRDASPTSAEVLIRTPLKELLAQLDPSRFWQIHRSVIVNQAHIASALRIDEGIMVLTLRGRPERLPVSRHFQGLFRGQ